MNMLIVGGTGFIGSKLAGYFSQNGFQVSVLTRKISQTTLDSIPVKMITALDPAQSSFDIIINLAGEPLNKHRWNESVKKTIVQSRIQTTQKIVEYIKNAVNKPKLFISGSAIGYYGNHGDTLFTEETPPADNGFTHQLCDAWEKVALQASQYGVRVCLIRTGIVLGTEGGALKEMLPAFKWGLGARLGNGKQWMSWIHLDDMVGAINYLITNETLTGAFNLTAPEPATNEALSAQLATSLHRPYFMVLPNWVVELLFGEVASTLLLNGQKVIPSKLLKAGYQFKFPKLSDALNDIVT